MGICQVPKIVVGNKNTEKGSIQIYGKDIDVLKLGDTTHEGGDVKIYRDSSGNLQFSVDANAASNAIAMSVYGGVVAQHQLTVGQAALHYRTFYVFGISEFSSDIHLTNGWFTSTTSGKGLRTAVNRASLVLDIPVADTDAIDHAIKLQIDSNDVIVAQATGNGSGGITNKAIGLYGTTPATQHAAIADATDAASAITQLNLLLAANRAIGVIAT